MPSALPGLRVLLATESDQLGFAGAQLAAMGHQVVAVAPEVDAILEEARAGADIALVSLRSDAKHALALIAGVAECGVSPVVVLLEEPDPAAVSAACKHGVSGFITRRDPHAWQATLEVALSRFKAHSSLRDAFDRRIVIERATGILMERHGVDNDSAFAMLRDHSRRNNRKLFDLAAAIVDGHCLLPRAPAFEPG